MDVRKKLVELLGAVSCNGNGESLGSCPDRKYGICGEMANLSYCVIQNTANHLVAHGVTVQEWIPASEPPTRKDADKYGRVLVMEMGMMALVNYKGPINYPDRFPYWMPLPQPPKGK